MINADKLVLIIIGDIMCGLLSCWYYMWEDEVKQITIKDLLYMIFSIMIGYVSICFIIIYMVDKFIKPKINLDAVVWKKKQSNKELT